MISYGQSDSSEAIPPARRRHSFIDAPISRDSHALEKSERDFVTGWLIEVKPSKYHNKKGKRLLKRFRGKTDHSPLRRDVLRMFPQSSLLQKAWDVQDEIIERNARLS